MSEDYRVADNQLRLLHNGGEYFPQLCADIAAAQHSIYLETYIFAADATGRTVAEALQHAAERGVSVRLLLDGFGSAELPEAWVDDLRDAGVQVQWFRREHHRFNFARHRLRRLHRKLSVIDGEIAFVGGINILDDVPSEVGFGAPRFDFAVRVQGLVVGEVHAAVRHLWSVVSWANLRKRIQRARQLVSARGEVGSNAPVAFIERDNLRHRRAIERAYLQSINHAQHEIIMANAYFLPGRLFRYALKMAAQRGVRVVLLLQGKVEYRLQHYATHALFEKLLSDGIEIYEYQPSYLHAKVAVVDSQWATIGSSNIDPFSLLLAREANLVVRDKDFATNLRNCLFHAIERDALCIEPIHWRHTGWLARQLRLASYAVVRLLIGVLGYDNRRT